MPRGVCDASPSRQAPRPLSVLPNVTPQGPSLPRAEHHHGPASRQRRQAPGPGHREGGVCRPGALGDVGAAAAGGHARRVAGNLPRPRRPGPPLQLAAAQEMDHDPPALHGRPGDAHVGRHAGSRPQHHRPRLPDGRGADADLPLHLCSGLRLRAHGPRSHHRSLRAPARVDRLELLLHPVEHRRRLQPLPGPHDRQPGPLRPRGQRRVRRHAARPGRLLGACAARRLVRHLQLRTAPGAGHRSHHWRGRHPGHRMEMGLLDHVHLRRRPRHHSPLRLLRDVRSHHPEQKGRRAAESDGKTVPHRGRAREAEHQVVQVSGPAPASAVDAAHHPACGGVLGLQLWHALHRALDLCDALDGALRTRRSRKRASLHRYRHRLHHRGAGRRQGHGLAVGVPSGPGWGQRNRPRVPRALDGSRCRLDTRGPLRLRLDCAGASPLDRSRHWHRHLRLRHHPQHAGPASICHRGIPQVRGFGERGKPVPPQHSWLCLSHLRAGHVPAHRLRMGQQPAGIYLYCSGRAGPGPALVLRGQVEGHGKAAVVRRKSGR
ncbi:hypothetical protein TCAP_04988 [Tolypocladium capitatum]|uniref:Uncharacterized protein n=1 Tax=Tolypocladium capitatum TaxID=45235 RepID=A0A2K3QC09_9HYPO|nr:hypothetical protein TCAP_04988 [Tolypocladium capitatum]